MARKKSKDQNLLKFFDSGCKIEKKEVAIVAKKVANPSKKYLRSSPTPVLSEAQKHILELISAPNFYTSKQIAIIRKTSTQAVYSQIKILRKKGLLNNANQITNNIVNMVAKDGGRLQPEGMRHNLHGEFFRIRILMSSERYKTNLKEGSNFYLDGNNVMLYPQSIVVSGNHVSWGNDLDECESKSLDYWNRFFIKLENRFNIIIRKNSSANIKRTKAVYVHTKDGIAHEAKQRGERLLIFSRKDSKLIYSTDVSFFADGQTHHKDYAMQDMKEAVDPFMNNLILDRVDRASTLSSLYDVIEMQQNIINQLSMHTEEIAIGLKVITNFYKSELEKIEGRTKKQSTVQDVNNFIR